MTLSRVNRYDFHHLEENCKQLILIIRNKNALVIKYHFIEINAQVNFYRYKRVIILQAFRQNSIIAS